MAKKQQSNPFQGRALFFNNRAMPDTCEQLIEAVHRAYLELHETALHRQYLFETRELVDYVLRHASETLSKVWNDDYSMFNFKTYWADRFVSDMGSILWSGHYEHQRLVVLANEDKAELKADKHANEILKAFTEQFK